MCIHALKIWICMQIIWSPHLLFHINIMFHCMINIAIIVSYYILKGSHLNITIIAQEMHWRMNADHFKMCLHESLELILTYSYLVIIYVWGFFLLLPFSVDYPDYGEFLPLIVCCMHFCNLFISFVYHKTKNDLERSNLVCALNKQIPSKQLPWPYSQMAGGHSWACCY